MSALRELPAWFTPKASTGALAICREVAYQRTEQRTGQRTGQMRRALAPPCQTRVDSVSTRTKHLLSCTGEPVFVMPSCRHAARTERRMMAVAEASPGANVIHT